MGKYVYVRGDTWTYVRTYVHVKKPKCYFKSKFDYRDNFFAISEFCRYRNFFVRYDEPTHVKHLKVEILPLIANDKNAKDIASELIEVRTYAIARNVIYLYDLTHIWFQLKFEVYSILYLHTYTLVCNIIYFTSHDLMWFWLISFRVQTVTYCIPYLQTLIF